MVRRVGFASITRLPSRETVQVSDLWQDGATLLYFMRRFGCPLCRRATVHLAGVREACERRGVKMTLVASEEGDFEEFRQAEFWPGQHYVDSEQRTFKGAGFNMPGWFRGLMALFKRLTIHVSRTSLEAYGGNMKSTSFVMGGVLLVAPGGQLRYMWKQQTYEELPDLDELTAAIDGLDADGSVRDDAPQPIKGTSVPAASPAM